MPRGRAVVAGALERALAELLPLEPLTDELVEHVGDISVTADEIRDRITPNEPIPWRSAAADLTNGHIDVADLRERAEAMLVKRITERPTE